MDASYRASINTIGDAFANVGDNGVRHSVSSNDDERIIRVLFERVPVNQCFR
jgi:hypothetical protein